MPFNCEKQLKSDAFGSIELGVYVSKDHQSIPAIKRCYTKNIFFRPMALLLARFERKALQKLAPFKIAGLPDLLHQDKHAHIRAFIPGKSMHHCPEMLSDRYFQQAKQLLRTMRKAGVVNNDLAKEANWLVTDEGLPAITDFQLALSFRKNRKFLRTLAREDLRHLLKHKRKYLSVTKQETALLNKKSTLSYLWRNSVKRLHRFITRKLLGWEDRNGPEERHI